MSRARPSLTLSAGREGKCEYKYMNLMGKWEEMRLSRRQKESPRGSADQTREFVSSYSKISGRDHVENTGLEEVRAEQKEHYCYILDKK